MEEGCGKRTGDEALEEGLVAQVLVVLLEVLLGGGDELDGCELEAVGLLIGDLDYVDWAGVPSLLEAADDLADEATLGV